MGFFKKRKPSFLLIKNKSTGEVIRRHKLCISQRVKIVGECGVLIKGADCCSVDNYPVPISVYVDSKLITGTWAPAWMSEKRFSYRMFQKTFGSCQCRCCNCRWF